MAFLILVGILLFISTIIIRGEKYSNKTKLKRNHKKGKKQTQEKKEILKKNKFKKTTDTESKKKIT